MAKDHSFDVAAQMTGGTSDKLEQTAQQQVREREEHGPNLPREGGPILRMRCPRRRSAVCVPFTVHGPIREWAGHECDQSFCALQATLNRG
jgi:hypothetical protein